MEKYIIALLLENEPGALSRVIGLFSARGYNIETISAGPTEDPTLSRVTITTTDSERTMEKIIKHLNRLVDVVKVVNLSATPHVEREMLLIKVRAVEKDREEIKRLVDIFRGRIVDVTDKSYTIELTGEQDKIHAFINALERDAIQETVRTGITGISRGERTLRI